MTEEREEYLATTNWGGRRIPGEGKKIGRPQKGEDKRKKVSFRLPPALADRLRAEKDQTALIVRLLSEYYGVTEL